MLMVSCSHGYIMRPLIALDSPNETLDKRRWALVLIKRTLDDALLDEVNTSPTSRPSSRNYI